MSRISFVSLATLLMVAASTGTAASVGFGTRVDLVVLDVCATDHSGRPARVEANELAVFDDGIRQQIALFLPGDRVPLAITLLVDSSQSMRRGLLDRATAAATALINDLPADSLVEVMSFNDRTTVLYPMGSDHGEAAVALTGVSPIGGTALYEAVFVAIREHERLRRDRQETYREAIVVLTDGENTAGRLDFEDLLDQARRGGILVYPVVLPPHDAPASGPPWRMTQLALDTGGKTVAARRADDLTNIYQQIAADVRNLYRVAYVPSPLVRDGTWHQVQVRAIPKDIVVRTRSGYYAPSQ